MVSANAILIPIFVGISVTSELILVAGFAKVKELRKFPGLYFLIQSICLIIFDLHFLTNLGVASNSEICKVIGAFWMSCYILAWCCNFLICLEVFLRLLNHKPNKKRILITNVALGCSWGIIFLLIIFSKDDPVSKLHTCSINSDSNIMLFLGIFVTVTSGLIIVLLAVCFRVGKRNSKMKRVLKYHLYVAIVFIVTLLPPTIINSHQIFQPSQIFYEISIYLMSLSGFIVFLARTLQGNLIFRIFKKVNKRELSTKEIQEFMLVLPYIQLFESNEISNLHFSLLCLSLLFKDLKSPEKKNSDWVRKILLDGQEVRVTEKQGKKFAGIRKKKILNNEDLACAFDPNENQFDSSNQGELGADGYFSFTSHNKRFVLRSLTKQEFKVFCSFLPAYLNRMEKRSSFLQHIFGLFKMRAKDRVLYLCVFENPLKKMLECETIELISEDCSVPEKNKKLLMTNLVKLKIINTLKKDTKVFSNSLLVSYTLNYIFTEIEKAEYKKSEMIMLHSTIGYFLLQSRFSSCNPSTFSESRYRDLFIEKADMFLSQHII